MYKLMGLIVLTSSRNASLRMRQFLNELEESIPNTIKVNRGKMSLVDLAGKVLSLGANKVLFVGERRGNPGFIRFMIVKEGLIEFLPYMIRIHGVKLTLDMQVRVERRRRPRTGIIVSLGERLELMDLLAEFLELPSIVIQDFESIRGMYDVILAIHKYEDYHEIQILNGRDLGPYGPFIRVSDVIYAKPRVIRVEAG